MRLRGIGGGILALIILQVLASRGGSQNVSGLLGAIATAAKRSLEPGVPAIPNLAGSSGKKPSGSAPAPMPSPGSPSPAPSPGLPVPTPGATPRPTYAFGPNNSPILNV